MRLRRSPAPTAATIRIMGFVVKANTARLGGIASRPKRNSFFLPCLSAYIPKGIALMTKAAPLAPIIRPMMNGVTSVSAK